MNIKYYLLLFTALLSVTGCSKDTITLLCNAEKVSIKIGDSYKLDKQFEGYEQKIYISFSQDSIDVFGGIFGESFKGIGKSSESYYAQTEYEEWTDMYKDKYKSRSISIDRLTLDYRIETTFTESIGVVRGNLFEGSCKEAKQQI
jgi:hypothetical protein